MCVSYVYLTLTRIEIFLTFQSERFKDELTDSPGPGAYTVSKSTDWLRKTYPMKKKFFESNEVCT